MSQTTFVYTASGKGPAPSGSTSTVSTVVGTGQTASTGAGKGVSLSGPEPAYSSPVVELSSVPHPRNSSSAGM